MLVPFQANNVRGAGPSGPGEIDYRLARHSLVSAYRKGRLAKHEVCDAHPELIRAARNVGSPATMACPICDRRELRLVTYVFGPRLPAHGRCVSTAAELAKLDSRPHELTAYVVEACLQCRWHHLLRVLPVGRPPRARTG